MLFASCVRSQKIPSDAQIEAAIKSNQLSGWNADDHARVDTFIILEKELLTQKDALDMLFEVCRHRALMDRERYVSDSLNLESDRKSYSELSGLIGSSVDTVEQNKIRKELYENMLEQTGRDSAMCIGYLSEYNKYSHRSDSVVTALKTCDKTTKNYTLCKAKCVITTSKEHFTDTQWYYLNPDATIIGLKSLNEMKR